MIMKVFEVGLGKEAGSGDRNDLVRLHSLQKLSKDKALESR